MQCLDNNDVDDHYNNIVLLLLLFVLQVPLVLLKSLEVNSGVFLLLCGVSTSYVLFVWLGGRFWTCCVWWRYLTGEILLLKKLTT